MTVTGKGDGGVHPPLPMWLSIPVISIAVAWTVFTIVIYFMIVFGEETFKDGSKFFIIINYQNLQM